MASRKQRKRNKAKAKAAVQENSTKSGDQEKSTENEESITRKMNPDAAPFKGPELKTSDTNHKTFFQNRKKPAAQDTPSNGGGQKTGSITGAKLSGKRGAKSSGKPSIKQKSNANLRRNKADETSDSDELPTCIVCTDVLKYAAFGPCNHKVCSKCSLRARVLMKNTACVYCKTKLDRVIITSDLNRTWDSFSDSVCGNYCINELTFDKESGSFFHGKKHLRDTRLKLRGYSCKQCSNTTFKSLKELTAHLQREHQMKLCMICVDAKQKFVSELPRYTKKQLDIHIRKGNPKMGFDGHPQCDFCRIKFYDDDDLFKHLHAKHFKCHVCEQMGKNNQYKRNYKELEDHFRRDHYICEETSCLEKRFVAFSSLIALQGHMAAEHPHVKYERKIDLNIKYKAKESTESSSNNNRNRNTTLPERNIQNEFNYNIAGERVEQSNGDGTAQLWHGAIGRNINSHDDFPSLGGGGGGNRNNLAAQLSKTFGSVSVASDHYSVDRQTNSKSAPPAPQRKMLKEDFPSLPKSRRKKTPNMKALLGPKPKARSSRTIEMPAGMVPVSRNEDPLVDNGPEWACSSCTLINPSWKVKCAACGTRRVQKGKKSSQSKKQMIPASVMMAPRSIAEKSEFIAQARTVSPPMQFTPPPSIEPTVSGLDLVTMVKRSLDGDIGKFESFQSLCRKYIAKAISPREYFMTVKRMFRFHDLQLFFPALMSTLPSRDLQQPLQELFSEATRSGLATKQKMPSKMDFEKPRKSASVAKETGREWPGLPKTEKPQRQATEQLKWAKSTNYIPKQPKSQWSQGSSSNSRKSRKKKSQKTKELQNLAFY
eukprot:g7253.t1